MIRITVELDKNGYGLDKEIIGTAVISNDVTGSKSFGNYKYEFFGPKQRIKKGRLIGFSRSRSVWWLIFYCLKLAFWENGKEGELLRLDNPQGFKRIEW